MISHGSQCSLREVRTSGSRGDRARPTSRGSRPRPVPRGAGTSTAVSRPLEAGTSARATTSAHAGSEVSCRSSCGATVAGASWACAWQQEFRFDGVTRAPHPHARFPQPHNVIRAPPHPRPPPARRTPSEPPPP